MIKRIVGEIAKEEHVTKRVSQAGIRLLRTWLQDHFLQKFFCRCAVIAKNANRSTLRASDIETQYKLWKEPCLT